MSHRHPALDSAFPPDDRTLTGRLMFDVALGLGDTDDILDDAEERVEDGVFDAIDQNGTVPTAREVRALLADVVREHDRLVTGTSPQRDAFFAALRALAERDVLASLSGDTPIDAVGDAFQLATELQDEGEDVRGFVFSDRRDLERLITEDRLLVGFGAVADGDEEAAIIGGLALEAFSGAGLDASWDGDPDHRIEIRNLRWAAPFAADAG